VLSTPYENRPPDLEHSGQGSPGLDGTGLDGDDAEGPGPAAAGLG
jgi:hypothetical protein